MFNNALIWAASWFIFAGYVNGASEDKSNILSSCKIGSLFKHNIFIAFCSTHLEHIVLQHTHEGNVTYAFIINVCQNSFLSPLCTIAHLFIKPFLVQSTGLKHMLKWTEFRWLSSSEKLFCNIV